MIDHTSITKRTTKKTYQQLSRSTKLNKQPKKEEELSTSQIFCIFINVHNLEKLIQAIVADAPQFC
jgi:hypothetical protein